jgi:hypothetical protein
MHEGDLEAEHSAPWMRIDEVRAFGGEVGERGVDVGDRVGDVVHARPALREEASDGRVVAERCQELHPAVADADRGRLDALLVDALAMLDAGAEQPLVRRHRLVEVRDRNADVVNAPCFHPTDVTVAPIARRLPICLCAVAAVLAGCGGSRSNGEAEKPAAQVVADAKAAAAAAKGVHAAGSLVDAGRRLTLDLELARNRGAKGTMSESQLAFDIVRVGGKTYIRGSDAFLRRFAGTAGAQLLHDKWLEGSATKGDLAALTPLTDIVKLLNGTLAGHGRLRNAGEVLYKGRKVVAIEDASRQGTLYVAATGKPYPIAISGGAGRGTVTFDRWDKSVSIRAPNGAIDMSQLGTD